MNKIEFTFELSKQLLGLPEDDIKEKVMFYVEMIDDRIDEGMSEADAVADVGSPDKIAEEIISEFPLKKFVKEKIRPKRRLKGWEIALIAVGSPIWISIGAVALSLVITPYAVLWSLVATAWAVFATFAGAAVGGVVAGVIFMATGNPIPGIVLLGAALVLAGLAIFTFFGCIAATKGGAELTKRIAIGIKRMFIKKGEAK